jgi:hypothetical protein
VATNEQRLDESSTTQYQKHNPSGFCYYIKCFDNSIYKPKLVHYTQQYEEEDITKTFVDMLEEEINNIHSKFKFKVSVIMTSRDIKDYKEATTCYACKK